MDRRRFLIATAATAGTGVLAGCDRFREDVASGLRWFEPTPAVHRPGMREGHALRDAATLPAAQGEIDVDVAILGSGVAALSAAWQLSRAGFHDFVMIDGPEFGGNASAGRFGALAYPRGAHYLPLPSAESTHVREMLADTGVIERDALTAQPTFDETAIVHAPEERLFFRGKWQDGLVPIEGVTDDEAAQHARFFAEVERLKAARGADGRKAFAIPVALASRDPAWLALDALTMRRWLLDHGFTADTLHAYVDYCCRDDYGAGHDTVSAWAGLHYFASRGGHAQNAADGAVLTWPDGLHGLVSKLLERIDARRGGRVWGGHPWRRTGVAARIEERNDRVEVLCVDGARAFRLRARRVVCAMPLHVAAHIAPLARFGFDARRHLPVSVPWLVSSFHLRGRPEEREGVPLAWDNVVHGSTSLGYVVSTHQWIRQAVPEDTVFTAYHALNHLAPADARKWLVDATPDALMRHAAHDLREVYGRRFWQAVREIEITVRGHGMASPRPGFLANAGTRALREADGRILFAHADLSGLSVFEEAAWWGTRAALRIVG
jgi:phytoene dehydrogenase-like protein